MTSRRPDSWPGRRPRRHRRHGPPRAGGRPTRRRRRGADPHPLEDEWANPLFHAAEDTDARVRGRRDPRCGPPRAGASSPPRRSRHGSTCIRHIAGTGWGLVGAVGGAPHPPISHQPGSWTLLRPSVSSSGDGGASSSPWGSGTCALLAHGAPPRRNGACRAAPGGVTIRPFREGDGRAMHHVLESRSRATSGPSRCPTTRGSRANLRSPLDGALADLPRRARGAMVGALSPASSRTSRGWTSWACGRVIAGRDRPGAAPTGLRGAGRAGAHDRQAQRRR